MTINIRNRLYQVCVTLVLHLAEVKLLEPPTLFKYSPVSGRTFVRIRCSALEPCVLVLQIPWSRVTQTAPPPSRTFAKVLLNKHQEHCQVAIKDAAQICLAINQLIMFLGYDLCKRFAPIGFKDLLMSVVYLFYMCGALNIHSIISVLSFPINIVKLFIMIPLEKYTDFYYVSLV